MEGITTKKTYTPLTQLAGAKIGRCSAMLPNRMQCWRAGDVLCETEITYPAAESTQEQPTIKVTSVQFCNAHAMAEQYKDAVDANAAQSVLAAQETAEAVAKAKENAAQTAPPAKA